MQDRVHPLEGISNFRDFGDYPTRDGARVVKGRLFRSGTLAKPTAADVDTLRPFDVRLVTDLRREYERVKEPSVWPEAGIARVVCGPLHLQRSEPPSFITFLHQPGLSAAETRQFAIQAFNEIPFDPLYLHLFGDALRAIADAEAAVVVHCSQGKDRTGLLCALTQTILGVPEELITADFELTNSVIDLKNRLPEAREAFSRRYGVNVTLEALEPMLGVEAAYLQSAFQSMRDRCGSIEAYLDEIGVTASIRERMRVRFLVE